MSAKTFRYYLPDHGQSAEDAYEVQSVFDADDAEVIAQDAAEDYHSNHDGWEASWPLEIVVLEGDKELGRFSVEREHEPRFVASKLADRQSAT